MFKIDVCVDSAIEVADLQNHLKGLFAQDEQTQSNQDDLTNENQVKMTDQVPIKQQANS